MVTDATSGFTILLLLRNKNARSCFTYGSGLGSVLVLGYIVCLLSLAVGLPFGS